MARVTVHLIPLLVLLMEYFSVSGALKIAQTMGEYKTVELMWGLVRLGDNISYHSFPMISWIVHITAMLLAVFYFYMVTLHGLGRNSSDSGRESYLYRNLNRE